MAIKLTNENGQRMVGVAYAEPSLHTLGVSEFLENDQFTNVEVSPSVFIYVMFDDVIAISADDIGPAQPKGVFACCQ